MFDFGWSEIALIGVVALVLIGPKDLPIAIRHATDAIKKMRRVASELQGHVDDMLREADLKDAHDTFRSLRGSNLRDKMFGAIDTDGSIRRAMTENPLPKDDILGLKTRHDPTLGRPATAGNGLASGNGPADPMPGPVMTGLGSGAGVAPSSAPAFVPPGAPAAAGAAASPRAPAFIPPRAAAPADGAATRETG